MFKLVRKLLWDGDNFLNDTTWESGYRGCLVHSLVPFLMVIGRFWFMGFLDWSFDWIYKGGWETITSFLEAGSDSWICMSLGIATYFLEYTLPIIRFSGVGSMDDNSGSKEGTYIGLDTCGRSMRKRSMRKRSIRKRSMKQESQSLSSSMEFPLEDKKWENKTHFVESNSS